MATSLRARQAELARECIVDACAELVSERRHLAFSMKDVAERAGVSLRTVYNHFPSRGDLLDELGHRFTAQMRERGGHEVEQVTTREGLLAAIRVNYDLFESLGGTSEAFAQMSLADLGHDGERRQRTDLLVDRVRAFLPGAPEPAATEAAVLMRHLFSHRSWFWLTRDYGLSTEAAAGVVAWGVETLIEAAENGSLPTHSEER